MEFNSVLAQTHPLLRSSTRFIKLSFAYAIKLLITLFYVSNFNNILQPMLRFQRFARKRNYQHFLEILRQNDK